jgi:hypothetical protein
MCVMMEGEGPNVSIGPGLGRDPSQFAFGEVVKSLSTTFLSLVLCLLLHGCKGEVPLPERTILQITSEPLADGVVLDLIRVRSIEGAGSESRAVLVAERPFEAGENPSKEAVILEITTWVASRNSAELNLEALGLSGGRVHARYEGLISIGQPGLISLKLLSIDGQCDGDADGYVDCSVPGCCEESESPFTDCGGGDPNSAPGQTEVCDGLDNDCDGETDEEVLNVCGECGDVPEEVCDAVDNDCDGETDEGFSWAGLPLGSDCKGYGGCGDGAGTVVCDLALETPTCSSMLATHPDSLLAPETCEGSDEDCDDLIDEDFTTAQGFEQGGLGDPCGFGSCVGGTYECSTSGEGTRCSSMEGGSANAQTAETCDGLDEDCDQLVDEGFLLDGAALSEVCTHPECGAGVVVCSAGGELAICDSTTNQLDTDSDGVSDCADEDDDGDGEPDLEDCAPLDSLIHGLADEICNGVDDDCNGETDETGASGEPCGEGACAGGTVTCYEGSPVCSSTLEGHVDYAASDETCNGIDDDCDGDSDEGIAAEPCGEGACAGGETYCDGGQTLCSTMPGGDFDKSSPELCDGLDNDCVGGIDNGFYYDQPGTPGGIAIGEPCDGSDADQCPESVVECSPDQTLAVCNDFADDEEHQELCDGQDNDCDGDLDEDFAVDTLLAGGGQGQMSVGGACDGVDGDECVDGVVVCDVMSPGKAMCSESNDPVVAYVFSGTTGGIQSYDVSDPMNPTWLSSASSQSLGGVSFTNGTVRGDHVFAVDSWFNGLGLAIVDFSDPSNPELVGKYTPEKPDVQFVSALAVEGDLAYVGVHTCHEAWTGTGGGYAACKKAPDTPSSGLHVVDISDPSKPALLGGVTWEGDEGPPLPRDIEVVDGVAYVAGHNGLITIDVTNPSSPYVLDIYDPWLQAFCESYYTTELEIETCSAWGAARSVEIVGDRAYLSGYIVGLMVIDITTPDNMSWVGYDLPPQSLDPTVNGSVYFVAHHGGFAFAATRNMGLSVYDLSVEIGNNLGDSLVGSFLPSEGEIDARYLQVVGETAFVTSYDGVLHVVDISNPISPLYLSSESSSSSSLFGLSVVIPADTALEVCDQDDNDCDGSIDEGGACDL